MPFLDFFWNACRTYRTPPKTDGINCAIGIAVMGSDDFQYRTPAEAPERFNGRIFLAALRSVKCLSDVALHEFRAGLQVLPSRTDPSDPLELAIHFNVYTHIRIIVTKAGHHLQRCRGRLYEIILLPRRRLGSRLSGHERGLSESHCIGTVA
jgi:hypothetical protein